MRIGLVKPNLAMLSAICRTCFFECVRALPGNGRRRAIVIGSMVRGFIWSILDEVECERRKRLACAFDAKACRMRVDAAGSDQAEAWSCGNGGRRKKNRGQSARATEACKANSVYYLFCHQNSPRQRKIDQRKTDRRHRHPGYGAVADSLPDLANSLPASKRFPAPA